MKPIKIKTFTLQATPRPEKNFIPEGEWGPSISGHQLMSTSHPFCKKVLETGAQIHTSLNELTIFAFESLVWVRLYNTHISIECITTYADCRGEKSATRTMKLLTQIADQTGTTLKLITGTIKWKPRPGIAAHPTIVKGSEGKKRISAQKLPGWFQQFGFVKGEAYLNQEWDDEDEVKNPKQPRFHMVRKPK